MMPHAETVKEAYKKVFLDSLRKSKNADSILVSVSAFSTRYPNNVHLIHGFMPVTQCADLGNAYDPNDQTPLNDAVFQGITGLVAYGQTLRDNGTRTKSIVVVLSDGFENASTISKTKVRNLATDVLRAHEFVLAYVFFGDEKDGDKMAGEIGFPAHHRLTASLDGSGIRRVFGAVSASVISTSQASITSGSLSGNAFFAQGR
jgi:hypothetical protein